ncbi:hypothetical protein GGI04_000734 [Coemansia thaxteri]|nr:hypothetical protein GGI04_000734 [Coemansia thaxteri]KAJ2473694.1 hypothetical protein GGI02_000668 [Coemansia sp. RSA 2322]KAJ2484539.1 hypothetical protein EV174_002363 [Coemansia sp. RSA 2320]
MPRAIYLFRNIRTKQVLATTSQSVMAALPLIKTQIADPALQPKLIRPDHWTPLVVATGFSSDQAHVDTFTLVTRPGHPLKPKSLRQNREYSLLTRRNKRLADMDMVESQIAQLARSFVYMDAVRSKAVPSDPTNPDSAKIRLLWENNDWIEKVQAAGLHWPQWIEHGKLELKRGNIITNKELKSNSPPPTAAT